MHLTVFLIINGVYFIGRTHAIQLELFSARVLLSGVYLTVVNFSLASNQTSFLSLFNLCYLFAHPLYNPSIQPLIFSSVEKQQIQVIVERDGKISLVECRTLASATKRDTWALFSSYRLTALPSTCRNKVGLSSRQQIYYLALSTCLKK